ncbi:hypothetical protein [Granulicoccus sp. GXG6511]|uniref:hypothetical protein n=1 Tax=Granulicoccus sp. GXG6511 TaxID=3381351 RepID=UPI003D7D0C8B
MGVERRGGGQPSSVDAWEHDVFLSCCGERAEQAAVLVRAALIEFGKRHRPQWERRIFIDRLALKAGEPDARAIEPLVASRVLVVVLDRETAGSTWANSEIETWLATTGSTDRLLLVSCSPELDLTWRQGSFVRADHVPPVLQQAFASAPSVFDLSMEGGPADRERLALYAAIAHIDLTELEADERRFQRRRHRRGDLVRLLALGLVILLAVLGFVAAR